MGFFIKKKKLFFVVFSLALLLLATGGIFYDEIFHRGQKYETSWYYSEYNFSFVEVWKLKRQVGKNDWEAAYKLGWYYFLSKNDF